MSTIKKLKLFQKGRLTDTSDVDSFVESTEDFSATVANFFESLESQAPEAQDTSAENTLFDPILSLSKDLHDALYRPLVKAQPTTSESASFATPRSPLASPAVKRKAEPSSQLTAKEAAMFEQYMKENAENKPESLTSILHYPPTSPLAATLSIPVANFNPDIELKRRFGTNNVDVDPNNPNNTTRERFSQVGSGRYTRNRLAAAAASAYSALRKSNALVPNRAETDVLPLARVFYVCNDKTLQSVHYTGDKGFFTQSTPAPLSPHHVPVRFVGSKLYERLYGDYQRVLSTYNIDAIVHFCQRYPYLPDALLQLSYILEYSNQLSEAFHVLKHALSVFEYCIGKEYMLHMIHGKVKLCAFPDPDYRENHLYPSFAHKGAVDTRTGLGLDDYSSTDYGSQLATVFHKILSRYALLLSRKSCNNTATALTMLAININTPPLPEHALLPELEFTSSGPEIPNPEFLIPKSLPGLHISYSDPSCALSLLDYYLYRSQQYVKIVGMTVQYTPYDYLPAMHPNIIDKCLFNWLPIPWTSMDAHIIAESHTHNTSTNTSSGSSSTTTSTSPRIPGVIPPLYTPSASASPIGALIPPLYAPPARHMVNWAYTAALAAYKLACETRGTGTRTNAGVGTGISGVTDVTAGVTDVTVTHPIADFDTSLTDILLFGGLRMYKEKESENSIFKSTPLAFSLLLQRALILYPETFSELLASIDSRAALSEEWQAISTELKGMYPANTYIDRANNIYNKRSGSLWKAHQHGGPTFISLLMSNVEMVLRRFKAGHWSVDDVTRVRTVVYNEEWYRTQPLPVRSMEQSHYTDDTVSIPLEMQQAQAAARAQQALRGAGAGMGAGVALGRIGGGMGPTRIARPANANTNTTTGAGAGVGTGAGAEASGRGGRVTNANRTAMVADEDDDEEDFGDDVDGGNTMLQNVLNTLGITRADLERYQAAHEGEDGEGEDEDEEEGEVEGFDAVQAQQVLVEAGAMPSDENVTMLARFFDVWVRQQGYHGNVDENTGNELMQLFIASGDASMTVEQLLEEGALEALGGEN